MSRLSTLFVLGGIGLLLSPITASAQFVRPFGLRGGAPLVGPIIPPVRLVPAPIVRPIVGFPQFYHFHRTTQIGFITPSGGFNFRYSQFQVGTGPWPGFSLILPMSGPGYAGGLTGPSNLALAAQESLEQAQRDATFTASLTTGTARNPIPVVRVPDVEPLPPDAVAMALAPADPAQIASGTALNDALKEITRAEKPGVTRPSAYIPPSLLRDVRFAGSPAADLLNFAQRNGLDVPAALDATRLTGTRDELAAEFASIAETVRAGKAPPAARVTALEAAFQAFEQSSAPVIKGLPEARAAEARDFLNRMDSAVKALKSGAANGLINPNWAVEGLSGADLVRHMSKYKLQFAPAPRGEEESYETLHRNLTAYLFVLTQPKK